MVPSCERIVDPSTNSSVAWTTICVDQDSRKKWTKMLHVMEGRPHDSGS